MSREVPTEPDLDLLYALAEAGVFGPHPQFSQKALARVMGCTQGNIHMLEKSIFRRIRRNPKLHTLRSECLGK